MLGDTRPRQAAVGAAKRHIRPCVAPPGDGGGVPPKQEIRVRVVLEPQDQATCELEPGRGSLVVRLCSGRGRRARCQGSWSERGAPGRPWPAADGGRGGMACRQRWRSSKCRALAATSSATEGAMASTAAARARRHSRDGARAWLLATRSHAPLPTTPRCGWHSLAPRAASAPRENCTRRSSHSWCRCRPGSSLAPRIATLCLGRRPPPPPAWS